MNPSGTGFYDIYTKKGPAILDEGVVVVTDPASINFEGAGVSVTAVGNAVTVTINGGATSVTLNDVSGFSDDAAKSVYEMTGGVPVEFQLSSIPLLYLDPTGIGNIGVGTNTPTTIASQTGASGRTFNVKSTTSVARFVAEGIDGGLFALVDSNATSGQRYFQFYNSSGLTVLQAVNDNGTAINQNFMSMSHSTGNIGIGFSTAAQQPLHVQKGGTTLAVARFENVSTHLPIYLQTYGADFSQIQGNAYFNGSNYVYTNTGAITAIRLNNGSGGISFATAASAAGGSTVAALTDVMNIGNTGDVSIGLGLSAASARLHVVKTTEQLRVGYDTSNYFNATVGSTGAVTFDAVGSGASFRFNDDVGIGVAPSNRLTIQSTAGGTTVQSILRASGTAMFEFKEGAANAGFMSIYNASAVESFRFNSNGLSWLNSATGDGLVIGGTSASAKLHVIGTTEQLRLGYDTSNYTSMSIASNGRNTLTSVGTSPGFTFTAAVAGGVPFTMANSASTGCYVGFNNTGSTGQIFIGSAGSSIDLQTAGVSRFRIDSSGLAGIGFTGTPASRLEVQGTTDALIFSTRFSSDASGAGFIGRKARGTAGAFTATLADDVMAIVGGRGATANNTWATSSVGAFAIRAAEEQTSTNQGTYASISTTPIGSTTLAEGLRVTPAGLTAFGGGGTSSFPAFKRSSAILQARLADDSAYTDIEVADEAYGAGWDGSQEVPTKNAVYDKIQTLGGGGIPGAFLTADQTTTSDTYADVTGFSFSAAANTTYIIDGELQIQPNNGQMSFQLTGPASPTTVYFALQDYSQIAQGLSSTDVLPNAGQVVTAFSAGISSSTFNAGSGNRNLVPIRIKIVNGANAGTVQLQYKANTNTESNKVLIGSYWKVHTIS